jgi:hypothetical protein
MVAKTVGHSVPPGYRQGKPRVRPKLDAHAGFIDEILKSDLTEAGGARLPAGLRTSTQRIGRGGLLTSTQQVNASMVPAFLL